MARDLVPLSGEHVSPDALQGIPPAVGLPIVAGLICVSAFFSGSEAALFSLQPVQRESMEHKGRAGRLVSRLLTEHKRTLASVLMGNELANITLSTTCAGMVLYVWPNYGWVNLLVATPILIFFGEITPKAISLRHASRLSRLVAFPLHAWATVVSPARWLLTGIADFFLKLLGSSGGDLVSVIGEQQLRSLIDKSREEGVLGETEQELIHRVFEFSDIPVSRLMTPRPDVLSIPYNLSYEKILEVVKTEKYSRIPVYKGRPDNMVGVLLAKDLVRFTGRDKPGTREIMALLQDPYFVPTTKMADELLDEFRRYRTHLALVVDEHGSLAGLVTLDDLLEELVGELIDGFEGPEIERIQPDIWTVHGGLVLEDFTAQSGVSLPEGEYHTLAGFVFAQMGHLPAKGESIRWDGIKFVVSGIDQRRITEITVHLSAPPTNEAAQ